RVSAAHPLYRDRHHLLDCRTASRMKGSPMNDSPSQEIAGPPRMRMRIFTVLALAWCATFLLLCVCQLVGLPLAIVVHPTGEDRVWTDLLEHSGGKRTAQAWWAIASRNPLAPWWYEAFSPLIQKVPGGLYVARKLLDLFLACSVALFINQGCSGTSRASREKSSSRCWGRWAFPCSPFTSSSASSIRGARPPGGWSSAC